MTKTLTAPTLIHIVSLPFKISSKQNIFFGPYNHIVCIYYRIFVSYLYTILNIMLNLNYSIKHKAKQLVKKSIKVSTWENNKRYFIIIIIKCQHTKLFLV